MTTGITIGLYIYSDGVFLFWYWTLPRDGIKSHFPRIMITGRFFVLSFAEASKSQVLFRGILFLQFKRKSIWYLVGSYVAYVFEVGRILSGRLATF